MARGFRLGHAHLKVVDLDRAIEFYTHVLGFTITEKINTYCFLTYGDSHHELAIHSIRGKPVFPTKDHVGLYHVAIQVPTFEDFRRMFGVLRQAGVSVKPVDHDISKALYFTDPDGNGLEIYIDTRKENNCFEWRELSRVIPESELLS